jgi:hypothetical protein
LTVMACGDTHFTLLHYLVLSLTKGKQAVVLKIHYLFVKSIFLCAVLSAI